MLCHKASLSTCLRVGIIATTFSDHCVVKLEINNQKAASESSCFYSSSQFMGQKIIMEMRKLVELKELVLS